MPDMLEKCIDLLSRDDKASNNQAEELLTSIATEDPEIIDPLGTPHIDQSGWFQVKSQGDSDLWSPLNPKATARLEAWLFAHHLERRHPVFLNSTRLVCSKYHHLHDRLWTNLSGLKQLEHLDLRQMGLKALPESVLSMTNLRSLNIAGNFMTELPAGIGNLAGLERLDAYKNRLQRLPSEIGNLNQLRSMCLYRNSLSELPESMTGLLHLKRLDIQVNPLQSLPPFLKRLPALEALFTPPKFTEEFEKGSKRCLVYDTWKDHHTVNDVLRDIKKQIEEGIVHSIHFDFGSFKDFAIYETTKHRYPDMVIIFEWRREAYY